MLRYFFYLMIFATSFTMACQQRPKDSASSTSHAIYSEDEFTNDYRNLEQAELALLDVGLKFKKTNQTSEEASAYVWDADFLKADPPKSAYQTALHSFIEITKNFLDKYSQPFFVILEKDKATLLRQIKHGLQFDLEGKLAKARASLVTL